MKIEASVSNFYEEAVEEVLISVRGDQSAKLLDMSGQEVFQYQKLKPLNLNHD